MLRLVLFALCFLVLVPVPALARCDGDDLIAAMAAPDRAVLIAAADSVPFANGNLFRATRADQVIDLIGTYHLPDPRHDALLVQAAPLIARAGALLVEAGPREESALQAAVRSRPEFLFRTSGPDLPALLGDDIWQAVAVQMQARGVAPATAARLRPWYLAMLLGIPPCAMAAAQEGQKGLDGRLIAAAEARGIPVQPLEPFDTLFSLFDSLTLDDELDMIRGTLSMADSPEDMAVTLGNAFFAGRSRLLWDFARTRALAMPGADRERTRQQFDLMEEVMMLRRNRAWIPVLTEAASRGPVLAAFGALHLSGAEGVLALLEAEGWQVERLDN